MKEVVRSACPGCQRPLTVPADWVGKTVRCKHCGHAMQVRARTPAKAPPPPLPAPRPQPVAAAQAAPSWEPLPDEAALPDYTPPLVTPAPAAVGQYVSAFDTRAKYSGRGRYKGPRNRSWLKYAVLGVFFAALAGGVGTAVYLKPEYFKSLLAGKAPDEDPGVPPVVAGSPHVPANGGPIAGSGAFPRRMLAISIHNYLYVNPLHNGETNRAVDEAKRTGTDAAIVRLAERWKVSNDQVYHLTDVGLRDDRPRPPAAKDEPDVRKEPPRPAPRNKGARKGGTKKDVADEGMKDTPAEKEPVVVAPRKPVGVPPLKSVVEGTITRFLETSRAQDRIVLLFCGHVVEKDGAVYLVPLEGDLDEVNSLIPLRWLYDKLAACPAQEKVAIFDVARFHPERGVERPHPGPMSEAVEKALHDSPDGVSVVTSCSRGEQSLEVEYLNTPISFEKQGGSGVELRGSMFLSLFHAASFAGALSPDRRLPSATDELPLERMTGWIGEKLGEIVKKHYSDRTQTVKTTIKRKADAVAHNGVEPMPGRFEFPAPPPSADPRSVRAIVAEIQLPPVKSFRDDAPPTSISDVLPFSEAALKEYVRGELRPSDKPNEFQTAVLDAVREMRGLRQSGSGTDLPEEFGAETSDRAKEELRKVQEIPARVEAILQDHLDALDKVFDQRDKQPKRWQVNYDYVLAQVKLRICYANQYNLAMANVRAGKLPDLKDGQNGYRLTAETTLDKNTPSNYKDMFTEARKALTDLAKEHPNTPWALLAKTDKAVAIGLRLTGSSVTAPVR